MTQEKVIQEITRRLVDHYHPWRIYLFGSVARGDDGPDSDLDFCVVVPDDAPKEIFRAGASLPALRGIRAAADVLPWRRTDFEQRAAWVKASLPATVLREGRILYEALGEVVVPQASSECSPLTIAAKLGTRQSLSAQFFGPIVRTGSCPNQQSAFNRHADGQVLGNQEDSRAAFALGKFPKMGRHGLKIGREAANASTSKSGKPSSRADCALRKSTSGARRTAPRTIALGRSLSARYRTFLPQTLSCRASEIPRNLTVAFSRSLK